MQFGYYSFKPIKMKNTFVVISLFFLFGCSEKPYKLEKPFIIYNKRVYKNNAEYRYFDKKGRKQCFEDRLDKFSVGDTIK
jgi:hypothetical protein